MSHKPNTLCASEEERTAYITGQMDEPSRRLWDRHLRDCDACRGEVAQMERTLARLRGLPEERTGRDLAPVIMARIAAERVPRKGLVWHMPRGWAAAAAAVFLAIGITIAYRMIAGARDTLPAVTAAVDWLCREQNSDGSWDISRWGGDPRYDIALTALSLLAIVEGNTTTPEQEVAIRKATRYLLGRQAAGGEFGRPFDSSPYNQGMATLALLQTYRRTRDESLRNPIDNAIRIICARQDKRGGWGYLGREEDGANLSITTWHVAALKSAHDQGWIRLGPDIDRALRWIAATSNDKGYFGYTRRNDFPDGPNTLTAMGAMTLLDADHRQFLGIAQRRIIEGNVGALARSRQTMDYYQLYFLAAALKQAEGKGMKSLLTQIRSELARRQETGHRPTAGTWSADDTWGAVGGRLYATALAALSLK